MKAVFRAYPGRIKPSAITRISGQILSIQIGTGFWGTDVRLMYSGQRAQATIVAPLAFFARLSSTVSGAGQIQATISSEFSAVLLSAGEIAADFNYLFVSRVDAIGQVSASLRIIQALSSSQAIGTGSIQADISVAAYFVTLRMRGRLESQSGELIDSPVRQQANDQIFYVVETLSDMGTSKTAVSTTIVKESDNSNVTSATSFGSLSISSGKLILPKIGTLTAGEIYRVNSQFIVGGNTINVFFRIIAE
jgi:hypothetical protein